MYWLVAFGHTKKTRESGRLGLGLPETFAANQRSPHGATRAATKGKARKATVEWLSAKDHWFF